MLLGALHAGAVDAVEKMLNTALRYDPVSRQKLSELDGRVILAESEFPPATIAAEPRSDQLILHAHWQGHPDTRLTGSLPALVALVATGSERNNFAGTGVEVSGDIELLRQFNDILRGLDVDWEAMLARLVGDLPAHVLGEAIRKAIALQRQAGERARSALGEVAQEELRLAPTNTEFRDFSSAVRKLAADSDRVAARVQQLVWLVQQKHGGESH